MKNFFNEMFISFFYCHNKLFLIGTFAFAFFSYPRREITGEREKEIT